MWLTNLNKRYFDKKMMKKVLKALREDGTLYILNCTDKEACALECRHNIIIGMISVCENKGKS